MLMYIPFKLHGLYYLKSNLDTKNDGLEDIFL